jgi:hypothetical protein
MPVQWTISHPTRLVLAIAKGDLCLRDIESYLDGVVMADALPHRKIFDLSDCRVKLSEDDMMVLGARIRAYPSIDRMGPLAIVAASDRSYRQARLFAALAETDRPLKIFRDQHLAPQMAGPGRREEGD